MKFRTFILRLVFLLILFFILDFLISAVLLKGLNKCYGIDQKPDILINGTSMSMNGFNRITMEQLTKRKIANYSNEGVCTWYDFAVEIIREAGLTCQINPVLTKDYQLAAQRPVYSVMDKSKIKDNYGLSIPHWRTSLTKCMKLLK